MTPNGWFWTFCPFCMWKNALLGTIFPQYQKDQTCFLDPVRKFFSVELSNKKAKKDTPPPPKRDSLGIFKVLFLRDLSLPIVYLFLCTCRLNPTSRGGGVQHISSGIQSNRIPGPLSQSTSTHPCGQYKGSCHISLLPRAPPPTPKMSRNYNVRAWGPAGSQCDRSGAVAPAVLLCIGRGLPSFVEKKNCGRFLSVSTPRWFDDLGSAEISETQPKVLCPKLPLVCFIYWVVFFFCFFSPNLFFKHKTFFFKRKLLSLQHFFHLSQKNFLHCCLVWMA